MTGFATSECAGECRGSHSTAALPAAAVCLNAVARGGRLAGSLPAVLGSHGEDEAGPATAVAPVGPGALLHAHPPSLLATQGGQGEYQHK